VKAGLQVAHDLAGTTQDSADELAALRGVLDDLLAHRYGLTL
jgi:hypothetical protein